jgi:hypothetical protein
VLSRIIPLILRLNHPVVERMWSTRIHCGIILQGEDYRKAYPNTSETGCGCVSCPRAGLILVEHMQGYPGCIPDSSALLWLSGLESFGILPGECIPHKRRQLIFIKRLSRVGCMQGYPGSILDISTLLWLSRPGISWIFRVECMRGIIGLSLSKIISIQCGSIGEDYPGYS